MEAIQKYELYLEALGVVPGDTAERVKQAFRKKIKVHHPDTAASAEDAAKAQTLIEAYEAFKKGVPKVEVERRSQTSGLYYRAEQHRKDSAHTHSARRGRAVTSEELGRAAGQRVFDSVFGKRPSPFGSEALDDAFGDLSEMLWGDVPETQIYGKHAAVREYRPVRGQVRSHSYIDLADEPIGYDTSPMSYEGSRRLLREAEELLRDIVSHFENAGRRRFTRAWMREYVAALTQVQVRFRDVSKYHAAFSARALRRVRQINELISEIKQSAIA